jgi:hypothetical protein
MRLIVLLGLLCCPPASAQPTVAGSTPGSFRVSESGAAEYRIPIRVPPGVAGMEPKLALAYNSQAGNGLLGVGWNLEGLSSITRCPRTMAQDGVRGAVNHDGNDRFCLDGQRLIAISGAYGAAGTEYRTEHESFSKIVSCGLEAGNGGPSCFEVRTKSGEVLEYGYTQDSRIQAQSSAKVRLWALNRIADRKGNDVAITYAEDLVNGYFRPARIDYAGKSVRFVYEPRTDKVPAYVGTFAVQTLERLSRIQTYVGETLLTDYRMGYEYSPDTARSRMTSIKECNGNASGCLAPIQLTSTSGGHGLSTTTQGTQHTVSGDWRTPFLVFPGDYDGDGRTDLFLVGYSAGYFCSGASLAASCQQTVPSGNDWRTNFTIVTGDFDGDGRTDLFLLGPGGVGSFFCSGATLSTASSCTRSAGPENDWKNVFIAHPGDYDGDGRTDLYLLGPGGVGSFFCSGATLSTSAACTMSAGPENDWKNVFVAYPGDYDGDGRADLFLASSGYGGYFCSGASIPTATSCIQTLPSNEAWSSTFTIYTGDFNGDGRTDLFLAGNPSSHFCSGHALTTAAACVTTNNDSWRSAFQIHVGDFDGDGTSDLLLVGTAATHFCRGATVISTAACLTAVPGDWRTPFAVYTGDFDGNGTTDVYLVGYANSYFSPGRTLRTDLVSTITGSNGASLAITQAPLTSGIYTKGSGAVFPIVDVRPPSYVVSGTQASDGAGGSRTSSYSYGGLRVAAGSGRGGLGFQWIEATDGPTGLKRRAEYRQDWPYVGLPSLVKRTQSSGAELSKTIHTYDCIQPEVGSPCAVAVGNRYFPFVWRSVESGNDLNGAALTTLITDTSYDAYGNPASVTVDSGGGYRRTTTNIYAPPDTANWLLGRLMRSTVQSTSP